MSIPFKYLLLLLLCARRDASAQDYHEFYLDIIQGRDDGSSTSSDCTVQLKSMLGESVVRRAQEFFLAQDINLDGSIEMQVDHGQPGTDMGSPLIVDGGSGGSDVITADDNNIFTLGSKSASPDYCCSHNHRDCGSDAGCNQSIDNCHACDDVWIVKYHCAAEGGVARYGDCTNKVNACCPGLECVADGSHYRRCDRVTYRRNQRSLQEQVDEAQRELEEKHRKTQQQQQQRGRLLYFSYWFKRYSANGKMRCGFCTFLNKDADHYHRERLLRGQDPHHSQRRTSTIHSTLHPEYESFMSFHLTQDVKAHLNQHNLNCLGRNIDDIEVYFAQGPGP